MDPFFINKISAKETLKIYDKILGHKFIYTNIIIFFLKKKLLAKFYIEKLPL